MNKHAYRTAETDLVTRWLTSEHATSVAVAPQAAPPSGTTPRRRQRAAIASLAVGACLLCLNACADDHRASAEVATIPTPPAPTSPATTERVAPTHTTDALTTAATTTTTTAATATTTAVAPTTTVPSAFEIRAVEFGFEGVPERLPAGTYDVTFTNHGTELHELLIFRNPEGLTLEEIHALGPGGAPQHLEIVGLLFADPGQPAPAPMVATLTPGTYEVVCFIPTPTDGQPHFAHGMHTTIEVSG